MTHVTLTGPDAGTPYCGVDKQAARERGDNFSHLPYSGDLDVWIQRPDICPNCRNVAVEAWKD